MWVNELAAPYAALAWLGGMVCCRSRVSAAVAGVALVLLAFFGYYFELLSETGSSPANLVTFANPWLLLELVCGVVFGLLGRRWVLRSGPWAAGTVALLTVLEAAAFATGLSGVDIATMNLYPPTYPWTAWNVAFWFVEASCGVLLAFLLVRRSRHRGPERFPIAGRRGR